MLSFEWLLFNETPLKINYIYILRLNECNNAYPRAIFL